MSMNGYNGANKITSHKGKESNHRKVIKNENELNKEAKKEMHRKCESRRRERINQSYDQLESHLRNTAYIRSKQNLKLDRCSLVRFTNGYMKEIDTCMDSLSKLLCVCCSKNKDLLRLFPKEYLRYILQMDFVDDDICIMLAKCFKGHYTSRAIH